MQNPNLVIAMASKNKIVVELFPDSAPNTVASVIWLAEKGLYDNRPFYRVIKDFVIQTGCARDMWHESGCEYIIDSECIDSGFTIPQSQFKKYIVGMAGMGKGSNITSGSEFFIMTGDAPHLDGNFPVIGKVISGFEEVDRINGVPCSDLTFKDIKYYQPLEKEIMEKVTVETFGASYPAPKTKPFPNGYLDEDKELDKLRLY